MPGISGNHRVRSGKLCRAADARIRSGQSQRSILGGSTSRSCWAGVIQERRKALLMPATRACPSRGRMDSAWSFEPGEPGFIDLRSDGDAYALFVAELDQSVAVDQFDVGGCLRGGLAPAPTPARE